MQTQKATLIRAGLYTAGSADDEADFDFTFRTGNPVRHLMPTRKGDVVIVERPELGSYSLFTVTHDGQQLESPAKFTAVGRQDAFKLAKTMARGGPRGPGAIFLFDPSHGSWTIGWTDVDVTFAQE